MPEFINPFTRFNCGCVGVQFAPDHWVTFEVCDTDETTPDFCMNCNRKHSITDAQPLTVEETEKLAHQINALIHHGYRFTELALALHHTTESILNPPTT